MPLNSANITTGPGTLMFAPIGTAEPTNRVAAWPAGWVKLGFTQEGHTFSTALTIEDIEVAESLAPLRRVTTKRDSKLSLSMAEFTLDHLQLALNGGTSAADMDGTVQIGSVYEPPNVGAEVRHMLGWDSEDLLERVIFRRCLSSGNVDIARKKGTDFAKIPVEFALETPTGGVKPFRHFFATSRVAA